MISALRNFPGTSEFEPPVSSRALDKLCINTLRFLAVDMVEQAKSGHPGLPLGAVPMVYVLWTRFLRHSPSDPSWPNREFLVELVLADSELQPVQIILIGTGAEVHLALTAQQQLLQECIGARVASMPSRELFDSQSVEYRRQVLPSNVRKLAIEAGISLGSFGASAPGEVVMEKLGFSVGNVVNRVRTLLDLKM